MKHSNKTRISLIISSITLLLSCGLYVYLYISSVRITEDVRVMYIDNAKNKEALSELRRVEQNLKNTLGIRDRLASLLVTEESVVDLIQLLESMMKSGDIDGAVDSVTESTGGSLDVTLSLSGSWNRLLQFTAEVENLPYKSTLDSLRMNYVKVSGDTSTVSKPGQKPGWNESMTIHVLMRRNNNEQL